MYFTFKHRMVLWAALFSGLVAVGCGGSNAGGGGTGGTAGTGGTGGTGSGDPALTISKPTANATNVTIGRDADKSVPIEFAATNFRLAATCNGDTSCGHIHVTITDSSTVVCNDGTNPYNNTATKSPALARFAKCAQAVQLAGMHTLGLELHHEDHTPVMVNGAAVKAQVAVTTLVETNKPTITITSPAEGGTLTHASDTNPVAFAVAHFTLMAAGSCGTTADCGHVNLVLASTATGTADCNDGAHAYNNTIASADPIQAKLSLCPTVSSGMQDATLELRKDNDDPVLDANGATVSARVRLTVQ